MDIPEEFRQLSENMKDLSLIPASSLPEIDLYMDQLTTFMEEKLKDQRRSPEDKVLTKTMINNYTKNELLPPPVKKKYSQDHLITLLYTYYLKNILSISDISALLHPMTEHCWDNFREKDRTGYSMKDIYGQILELAPDLAADYCADIREKMATAAGLFGADENPEERIYLQRFSLTVLLAFDVYLKKKMMESIIDEMRAEERARAASAAEAAKRAKTDARQAKADAKQTKADFRRV